MKLLLDMNLSPQWLGTFRAADLEAVHWSSVGRADAPDETIMEFAEANGMVLLTQDLDFGILLAKSSAARPSVVQLRSDDILPGIIGGRVVEALRQMAPELAAGALLTIDPRRTRVRVLPLRNFRSGPALAEPVGDRLPAPLQSRTSCTLLGTSKTTHSRGVRENPLRHSCRPPRFGRISFLSAELPFHIEVTR